MDPLSITASVLAIVGALRAVTKGYKRIADLGRASQEFTDLVDEIESVHAYLGMLHSVLASNTHVFATIDLTPLGTSLSRLDFTVQKLQSALKQAKADSESSDDHKISKIKWQVYKSKLIQLLDEVRCRKQDLVDKVGVLQLALSVLHSNLLPITHAKTEISYTRHDDRASEEPQSTAILDSKQINPLDVRSRNQVQRRCPISCSCRCHQLWATRSQPSLLSTIRRILSLVATTAHYEPILCDDQACRDITQQKFALVFQIPLFRQVIWLRLAWTTILGPGTSLYLRVGGVITNPLVLRTAAYGDPQRLRRQFEERIALPNDIASDGSSLLLVAVKCKNLKVIEYLLELGVDVFQPDFFGMSPALGILHLKRHYPNSSLGTGKLQALVEEFDPSSPRENPLITVLENGTDAALEDVLNENPSLVNEPEFGASPLHIATNLRRYSMIKLLLLRGADPRKWDIFGFPTLHHAIWSSDVEATRILLHFSSERNVLNIRGTTALEEALQWSSNRVISMLLSFGMKIRLGSSNVFVTLAKRRPPYCDDDDEDEIEAIAQRLLNDGLNFDDCGGKPCEEAVATNNVCVLRVLLNMGADFYGPKEGECSVLHLAGDYATMETIELLREANIEGLDPDAKWKGWTAMEIFDSRTTYEDYELSPAQTRPTAEESIAFRALIDEVRERYSHRRTLLETYDQGIEIPEKSNVLLGEEDGKPVGIQASLPGAWVE